MNSILRFVWSSKIVNSANERRALFSDQTRDMIHCDYRQFQPLNQQMVNEALQIIREGSVRKVRQNDESNHQYLFKSHDNKWEVFYLFEHGEVKIEKIITHRLKVPRSETDIHKMEWLDSIPDHTFEVKQIKKKNSLKVYLLNNMILISDSHFRNVHQRTMDHKRLQI